ncbi:BON domain-containing protein [Tahibacter amnicola]|uniref:BON domain-containing protein n=1 Tax=Tahibacter amnicola TaxID=2976241 RepID=A0ABY6BJJ1_9GAMM|nr:BON domain-containing protein [Tahibacter amnicola]UXI70188.1 BON domain-containing protein [Tahibacter amnicola]
MNARLKTTVCAGALLVLSLPAIGLANDKDKPRADPTRTEETIRSASNETPVSGDRADNTRINKRDQDGNTATPDDQPNDSSNLQILADVRKAIVDDDSLSTMAHNVKILADGGVITLRGPVNGTAEKDKVATIARRVAGVTKVNNELDVKK